jgi:6-phosphogluconolactonase
MAAAADGPPPATPRTVRVLATSDDAADAVAAIVVRTAAAAIAARGVFTLALSGGRTPLPLFERLAALPQPQLDWSAVHVFWADERCVAPDHVDSNYGSARVNLLDRVRIPPTNLHRIRGEMTPPVAAGIYRAELATFFRAEAPGDAAAGFDLVLLGIGGDGHVASIFPGSPALEAPEWALDVQAPPGIIARWRVTLTRRALAAADHVIVLATGTGKAEAVAAALAPERTTPAGRLSARSCVTWFIDEPAAACLDAH